VDKVLGKSTYSYEETGHFSEEPVQDPVVIDAAGSQETRQLANIGLTASRETSTATDL
jgi:hypothetical protein